MIQASRSASQNITLTDVQLASAYYPILMELALQKKCLTYTELVDEAKRRYPDKAVVLRAVAMSTARRLELIRRFTVERDLPDLSSLITNKDIGQGIGDLDIGADAKDLRDQVYAYDWSTVCGDFEGFIQSRKQTPARRKKVTKLQALELMSQYYQAHKARLPVDVRRHRDSILELLGEGLEVAEVFELVLKERGH